MGRMGAESMAEQVDLGTITLTQAVSWHLSSNHYPPVPSFMVPVAVAAVEAGREEEYDRVLELPKGCSEHRVVLDDSNVAEHEGHEQEHAVHWRNSTSGRVLAGDVIESFHLDGFLD